MSDDGFSDCFEEPNMEIQIKTLMGTTFDIKVSSNDTIGDIKKKIFRVEGIPIYQQNLIFQSEELTDSKRLCDSGIQNGSTLTLVAAMRGGPISTRRMSMSCDHHVMLKELKDLLENTRDELTPGSKVSVLVFKEGDIINLLRVIENEDGSYSPYSENPISPPSKPPRRDSHVGTFERLVEDTEMCTKITNLRKKMGDASVRRQSRSRKPDIDEKLFGDSSSAAEDGKSRLSFKFLEECATELLDNAELTVFEKHLDDENQSETEEIALKDKHRSKPKNLQSLPKAHTKSLYSERKGSYSSARQNYTWMHKKHESRLFERPTCSRERKTESSTSKSSQDPLFSPLEMGSPSVEEVGAKLAEQLQFIEDDDQDLYGESFSVSARNRVRLTRLVLSEGVERPKSSPDSIELEEHAPDFWEIHEPASERLKHSATCKVGLLKRRQGLEYNYEGLENGSTSKIKPELGNYSTKTSTEFGICSGANFYMPQFMSAPSAIPPQYAPKPQNYCDLYFGNERRSPLYSRRNRKEAENSSSTKDDTLAASSSFLSDCSSIQRLKNDCKDGDSIFGPKNDSVEDQYGYYSLGCSAGFIDSKKEEIILPPVIKKKSRCSECNKRLNITNIYNCRCGRIFCSQHRYSEVHRCTYDYKTEGRKILEHQNPLVTAEKVKRF